MMRNFFWVIIMVSTLSLSASGQESSPQQLHWKTEKVIVFKDGYSLVLKKGTAVTDDKGVLYSDEVPDAAVLGSFWATAQDGKMVSMRAGWVKTEREVEKDVRCTQNIEILEANKGKPCQLELLNNTRYSGTIREVLVRETSAPVDVAMRSAFRIEELSSAAVVSGITGSSFVLRTDQGDVLIPVDQIRTLLIREMNTTIARIISEEERHKRLYFHFAEAGREQQVTLMYFRPGMRWVPTYRIDLPEKADKAHLSLQAELINEMEDFRDVPFDIVVGVPNFRFRDTVSPLVLESTLRNALQQANPHQQLSNFSNALYTQQAIQWQGRDSTPNRDEDPSVQLPSELTGTGTQDLFVYHLPKLSLAKEERMAVRIFDADVPYRSVYTWEAVVKRNMHSLHDSGADGSPLQLSSRKVWHQAELENTTGMPWTTGAAMIMRGYQPLAQDLLTYTSPGSKVRIPVTVAVDLHGDLDDEEISRKLQAMRWNGDYYAEMHNRATLTLTNAKAVPITTEISLRMGGKVEEASSDGKVSILPFHAEDWQNYYGNPAVNSSSLVRWKISLKPGETFRAVVSYRYYIRH